MGALAAVVDGHGGDEGEDVEEHEEGDDPRVAPPARGRPEERHPVLVAAAAGVVAEVERRPRRLAGLQAELRAELGGGGHSDPASKARARARSRMERRRKVGDGGKSIQLLRSKLDSVIKAVKSPQLA